MLRRAFSRQRGILRSQHAVCIGPTSRRFLSSKTRQQNSTVAIDFHRTAWVSPPGGLRPHWAHARSQLSLD